MYAFIIILWHKRKIDPNMVGGS